MSHDLCFGCCRGWPLLEEVSVCEFYLQLVSAFWAVPCASLLLWKKVNYPDLVGQSHVDHVAEGITNIRKDLMNGLPHGLEEKLVISVKAPTGMKECQVVLQH